MTQNNLMTLNKKDLENYILDAMERWEVPGLAIAIVKDGKTLLQKHITKTVKFLFS